MSNKSHNVNNKDLIELKKMRQGLISPPKNDDAPKQKLKGFPAFANFLRYHVWHIVVIACAFVFVVSLGKKILTEKTPDCLVVINTGAMNLSEVSNEYAKVLTEYCPDSNGDGKTLVEVLDCSYDENGSNKEEIAARATKFKLQFNVNHAQLFILSYDNMVKLEKEIDGGLWVADLNLSEYDGKAVKLNGTKFDEILKENDDIGYTEDVSLCMRKSGKHIANSKNGKPAIKAAKEILFELDKLSQK